MNPQSYRNPNQVFISVDASNPHFLEGLEIWLSMGLITHSQVRQLCEHRLICPLPQPVPVIAEQSTPLSDSRQRVSSGEVALQLSFIPRQSTNFIGKVWQDLRDELSVRWLLFLGLFLVIVSSCVLAATQWQIFPSIIQYIVLFCYTFVFWWMGFWTSRQPNLLLTSQTIKTIFILLIPVNFWAMDSFGLWGSFLGSLTVLLTSGMLTFFYYKYGGRENGLLLGVNYLGLGYLHWGWDVTGIPLAVVYLGLIITTVMLRFVFSLSKGGLLIYALSVLLLRGIFLAHLPISQLGLALGICGWLLQSPIPLTISSILEPLGIFLLVSGWWISLGDALPIQATGVSALGLHFFVQRLKRDWLGGDLLALFVIGLQGLFLIARLIPPPVRQGVVNLWLSLNHYESFTFSLYSLYSLTLFPYLLCCVLVTNWLQSLCKSHLVRLADFLTLFLGLSLTLLSLFNPTARSLNLILSATTLVYLSFCRVPVRVNLIYFAHVTILLAFCSILDWCFPSLSQSTWAVILLGLTVTQWCISTNYKAQDESLFRRHWYGSCWHLAFVLASIGYVLLWDLGQVFRQTGQTQSWVLWWLLIPLTLTSLAWQHSRHSEKLNHIKVKQAAFWSIFSLIALQFLTLWQPHLRLIGLATAMGLMLFNTYYLPHRLCAIIQLGFSLCFYFAFVWQQLGASLWQFALSANGLLVNAIAICLLWSLSIYLRRKNKPVLNLYAQGSDFWGAILCVYLLIGSTGQSVGAIIGLVAPSWQLVLGALLVGGSLASRHGQHLNDWCVYVTLWLLEIIALEIVIINQGNTQTLFFTLATVNIVLSWLTYWLTSDLLSRYSSLQELASIKIFPLLLALIGIVWRWGNFNVYTGLLTVGGALTGLGVGYRLNQHKFITYLSVAGISLGIYESVIYQMSKSSGGSVADGLMILALSAGAIAFIYRLFAWVWRLRGKQIFANLTLNQIQVIAHIHWGIASFLKGISLLISQSGYSSEYQLNPLSLIVSFSLTGYAFIQGRDPINSSSSNWIKDLWIYLGLIDLLITINSIFQILQLSIFDKYRVLIVCLFALLIYHLPWRFWGWRAAPWRRLAYIIPFSMSLIIRENLGIFDYLNLLFIAAFYAYLSLRQKNIRWTYISLFFIDYSLFRFSLDNHLTETIISATIIGVYILYIAQFDQIFRRQNQRKCRHNLRLLGSCIICITGIIFYQKFGLTPGLIGLVFIFTGLSLQIRAFLFTGTITLIVTVLYQGIVLSFQYAFLKWIIIFMVGIILMTIAANFEQRRDQIIALWENWLERLRQWE